MRVRLRGEDRHAVDLLLDHTHAAAGNGSRAVFAAVNSGASQDRVRSVQKVLKMLELLPSTEPAGDLVAKTLRRIDESVNTVGPGLRSLIDSQQPIV